jgi:hypothetical protein
MHFNTITIVIWSFAGFFIAALVWAWMQPPPEQKEPVDTPAGRRARTALAAVICAVGACSFFYRWLVNARIEQTSALFVGVPTLLAVMVVLFTRPRTSSGLLMKAMTVFLLVSGIFLGEGFICIVMASPIFYGVAVIVGALFDRLSRRKSPAQTTMTGLLLIAMLPMSFEGTSSKLSFNRSESVTAEALVHASPAEVRNALAATPHFTTTLPFYLRLRFPRPVATSGQGLAVGDRRVIHFAGGEGKPGDLTVEVVSASDSKVNFRVVSDTSKIAHWLAWQSTEVEWSPDGSGQTRVRFTLRYKRLLDPAWYFGPWERYAVGLAGGYFIENAATPR